MATTITMQDQASPQTRMGTQAARVPGTAVVMVLVARRRAMGVQPIITTQVGYRDSSNNNNTGLWRLPIIRARSTTMLAPPEALLWGLLVQECLQVAALEAVWEAARTLEENDPPWGRWHAPIAGRVRRRCGGVMTSGIISVMHVVRELFPFRGFVVAVAAVASYRMSSRVHIISYQISEPGDEIRLFPSTTTTKCALSFLSAALLFFVLVLTSSLIQVCISNFTALTDQTL